MAHATVTSTSKKNRKPAEKAVALSAAPNFEAVEGEMIRVLPGQLVGSEYNVRNDDTSCVKSLSASIVAKGVLQNFVVVDDLDADGNPTGFFGTAAGGRRRRALQLAVSEGRWPADRVVWAKKISHAAARLASLGENAERLAMHPLDEFVAFRDLHAEGRPVEDIAAAFAVEPDVVKRRLKLANVAPDLLAAYRADQMTLEVLMAFAIKDDHAQQLRVWQALPEYGRRHAHTVRNMMTEGNPSIDSPLVRFVGMSNYKKAGGSVLHDLFGSKDDSYVENAELLQQLADDKLAGIAKKVAAEGWGWVESRIDFTHADHAHFERVPAQRRDPSTEEFAALKKIAQRLEKAEAAMAKLSDAECWSDDDVEKMETLVAEAQEATDERDALTVAMCGLPLELLQASGAVVCIDHMGRANIVRGLVRDEDKKRVRSLQHSHMPRQGDEGVGAAANDEPASSRHSESLVRRLTANRTAAMQLLLARNHHVAQAALAQVLVERVLCDIRSFNSESALCIEAKDCAHEMTTADEGIDASPARTALAEHAAKWTERIEAVESGLLPWLIELQPAELAELLALCTALTVNAIARQEGAHNSDALAQALGLDMADYWQPTAAAYLSMVPKAQILTAVTQAVSADEAAKLDKLKKPDMVQAAETLLQGRRWLPSLLQLKEAA